MRILRSHLMLVREWLQVLYMILLSLLCVVRLDLPTRSVRLSPWYVSAGRQILIDRYKCMNTGSRTTCPRHLRVYLARSPVSLVASRCIASLWKKLASLLSSIPPSSTTIPRTESITSIPRIFYSSAKIVILRRTGPPSYFMLTVDFS